MDKFVLMSLLLSIGWHSLAFVLFKLTEPYHSKVDVPAIYEVKLVESPAEENSRLPHVQHSDLLNRFTLPERVDPLLPVEEYALDLARRGVSLRAPDMSSGLIEHKPHIIETPLIHHVGYDIVPYSIRSGADSSVSEKVDLSAEPVRTVQYRFSGMPLNRTPVDSTLPDSIRGRGSISIRFSIDNFGSVRFVIVERSTGDQTEDQRLISLFKTWRFSKVSANEMIDEKRREQWGRVIFFVEESL
ncbi:MAG: hypothetical protein AB1454_01270 [Candidatus Auribacterota bacterium]